MNIPSTRTWHDMEIAADLRAQGGKQLATEVTEGTEKIQN
jgi:hypothetical protein